MTGKPPPPEQRRFATLPLAQLVPGVSRAVYRKRSPAGASLMADWPSVVGPRLAAETEPRRLSGKQLTIACSGPMALELQHLADEVIRRINVHAGETLVERLRFVQDRTAGAVAHPPPPQAAIAPEPVDGLPPGELNDALGRLLAAIRSRQ